MAGAAAPLARKCFKIATFSLEKGANFQNSDQIRISESSEDKAQILEQFFKRVKLSFWGSGEGPSP